MSIGVGIFLLTIGAILAFAVSDRIDAIDLTAVGIILMAAGAFGMALSLILSNRRRRAANAALDPEVVDQYKLVEGAPEVTQVDPNLTIPEQVVRRPPEA